MSGKQKVQVKNAMATKVLGKGGVEKVVEVVSPIVSKKKKVKLLSGMQPFSCFPGHDLGERGREFVHRFLDPCGEDVTFNENSKIPDGALPNSTVLELRQVQIVRAPTTTNDSISLSGSMWTLTVIHTPMFRTPIILVANMANAEMSASDENDLISGWNTTANPPVYPSWNLLASNPNAYWTTVEWSGLADIPTPTMDGAATAISQFRICSDGVTIFNNTPDLVNQGMVIGAQWNTDQSPRVFQEDEITQGYIIQLPRFWTAPVSDTTSPQNFYSVAVPAANTNGFENITATGAAPSATYVATAAFMVGSNVVSVGDLLTLTISMTYSVLTMTFTGNLTDTTTSTTLVNYNNSVVVGPTTGTNTTQFVVSEIPPHVGTATQWQLPPLTTQGIIQSSPKAVYLTMKEENGVYMVKRVFQPVFNVTEASSYKPVRMVSVNQTSNPDDFVGGKWDTFDSNFSTGVIVMSSIPTSCAPSFKMKRDVEVVANDGSPFQMFMETNEDPIPEAIQLSRAVIAHHPFMYPESYNSFGGLFGILEGILGKIPIIGNILPVITPVIKGLVTGEKSEVGSSQNRLASLNQKEMEKLVEMMLTQMKIGK